MTLQLGAGNIKNWLGKPLCPGDDLFWILPSEITAVDGVIQAKEFSTIFCQPVSAFLRGCEGLVPGVAVTRDDFRIVVDLCLPFGRTYGTRDAAQCAQDRAGADAAHRLQAGTEMRAWYEQRYIGRVVIGCEAGGDALIECGY